MKKAAYALLAVAVLAVFVAGIAYIYQLAAAHFGFALTWKDWVIVSLAVLFVAALAVIGIIICAFNDVADGFSGFVKGIVDRVLS